MRIRGQAAWLGAPLAALVAILPLHAAARASISDDDFAFWSAELKLDASQQALLRNYDAVANPRTPPSHRSLKAVKTLSAPERLAIVEADAQETVARIRTLEAALSAFYASLSPTQKTRWDAAEQFSFGGEGTGVAPDPTPRPHVAGPGEPKDSPPAWLEAPDGEVMSRLYPKAMRTTNISGRAKLLCTADRDGYLYDCIVEDEEPKGSGFAAAALAATAYTRLKPAFKDGVAVESPVRVPFGFKPQRPGGRAVDATETSK